jgi:hypothetical protein
MVAYWSVYGDFSPTLYSPSYLQVLASSAGLLAGNERENMTEENKETIRKRYEDRKKEC